ncbi:MAG: methyltransferase domain-containing protein, partial [Clostridia bacterium]|nr:methyltransferase domain-containing protein [Clostridia bacterium]
MEITNQKQIKEIAERFGVAPNKSFGQNFLLDGAVLTKISNAAFKDGAENVLEIGPGMGALTDKLCQKAKKVVAVEIDGGMVRVLSHTLSEYSNVEIINGDILDKNIQEQAVKSAGKPFAICANLPYYITTSIIMSFLEGGYDFSSMV